MATKYYLKKECKTCTAFNDDAPHRKDLICKGTGFVRGADVTELMTLIKSFVTKQVWELILGVTKHLIEVVENETK